MALPQQGSGQENPAANMRVRIDVAQLVTRGIRLELTLSEDGAPAELISSPGKDRLMVLSNLMAQGYKLETTGADAIGPHTLDTLVRARRVPVNS